MPPLAVTRSGTGPPLVLLHALGLSRRAWDPVLPALTARFDVIAVDLPGFGDSAPLNEQAIDERSEVSPAELAQSVADLLDGLGISPPHLAGNSLGGWVALELAELRPVASVTLLSPAGLWRRNTPLYDRISLRASRWLAQHAAGTLSRLVRYRLGRVLVLGQTHGRPMRLTAEYARAAVEALGRSPGYDAALAGTTRRRIAATGLTGVPVAVAFGSRDLLLRRAARRVDQLPPQTLTVTLPGCGHIPMSDDPDAVAALITRATARAAATVTQKQPTASLPSALRGHRAGRGPLPLTTGPVKRLIRPPRGGG